VPHVICTIAIYFGGPGFVTVLALGREGGEGDLYNCNDFLLGGRGGHGWGAVGWGGIRVLVRITCAGTIGARQD